MFTIKHHTVAIMFLRHATNFPFFIFHFETRTPRSHGRSHKSLLSVVTLGSERFSFIFSFFRVFVSFDRLVINGILFLNSILEILPLCHIIHHSTRFGLRVKIRSIFDYIYIGTLLVPLTLLCTPFFFIHFCSHFLVSVTS